MLQVELIFCNVVVCEANGICCRSLIALPEWWSGRNQRRLPQWFRAGGERPEQLWVREDFRQDDLRNDINVQFLEFSPVPKSEGPGAPSMWLEQNPETGATRRPLPHSSKSLWPHH